MLFEIGW